MLSSSMYFLQDMLVIDLNLSTNQIALALVLLDSGIKRFICLESDNESEGGSERGNQVDNETMDSGFDVMNDLDRSTKCVESTSTFGTFMLHLYLDNGFFNFLGTVVENAKEIVIEHSIDKRKFSYLKTKKIKKERKC